MSRSATRRRPTLTSKKCEASRPQTTRKQAGHGNQAGTPSATSRPKRDKRSPRRANHTPRARGTERARREVQTHPVPTPEGRGHRTPSKENAEKGESQEKEPVSRERQERSGKTQVSKRNIRPRLGEEAQRAAKQPGKKPAQSRLMLKPRTLPTNERPTGYKAL